MWSTSLFLALLLSIGALHSQCFPIEPRDAESIFKRSDTAKLAAVYDPNNDNGFRGVFFTDKSQVLKLASQLSSDTVCTMTVVILAGSGPEGSGGLMFNVPYPEAIEENKWYGHTEIDTIAKGLLGREILFPSYFDPIRECMTGSSMTVQDAITQLQNKAGAIIMAAIIGNIRQVSIVVSQRMFDGFGVALRTRGIQAKPLRFAWDKKAPKAHYFAAKYTKGETLQNKVEVYFDNTKIATSTQSGGADPEVRFNIPDSMQAIFREGLGQTTENRPSGEF